MGTARDRCWEEWVNKEFISTMVAKGKMEVPVSEARERNAEHLYNSIRVFPTRDPNAPPFGPQDAEKVTFAPGTDTGKAKASAAKKPRSKEQSAARKELKERLAALQAEVETEQALRKKLEDELHAHEAAK